MVLAPPGGGVRSVGPLRPQSNRRSPASIFSTVLAVVSLGALGMACNPPPPECGDGADNDRDGLVDSADPGCTASLTDHP